MGTMRSSYLAAVLILGFSKAAFAQHEPPLDLGKVNGVRVAVSAGMANQRVGNAVLVRIHLYVPEHKIAFSRAHLVACDSSWISSEVHFAAKVYENFSFTEIERYGRDNEDALPLSTANFFDRSDSKLYFAGTVMRRAAQLCKFAAREPRNTLIPVARTTEIDGAGKSIAIVLGTSAKVGHVIDVWMRSTWYKKTPLLDKAGAPMTYEGEVQTKRIPTGKFTLERAAFDCRSRELAVYSSAIYETEGAAPSTSSIPRDKVRLSSVLPDSVGEAELEAVCKLYGT